MEKKRGGQEGNKNAKRAKHPRLAVSYSGDLLDLAYEKLADQGNTAPTEDQIKDFIRAMTRKGLEQ
jgi:hypothetical protein